MGETEQISSDKIQTSVPDRRTMTSAWVEDSVPGGRTFAKIIEEQKNRNIIELQITRHTTEDEHGTVNRAKPLTFEDLGEFLFDILEMKPEDCISFNFSSGRYDIREVKFKPRVDTSPYLRLNPVAFKDHSISVRRQRQNIVRVTLKNMPLNVPDGSEGRESRSRLGLETEGTETLGLVSVSYTISELVSSRSRLG